MTPPRLAGPRRPPSGACASSARSSPTAPHRLTPGELPALRSDGPSGPAVLAAALRRLAKARAAGDRGGLREALGEVAAAAVRWRDRL